MPEPSDLPFSTGLDESAEDPAEALADHDVEAGGPDPLDALRTELSMIAHQPVADRVARFEHANVVLAAALAELDEV